MWPDWAGGEDFIVLMTGWNFAFCALKQYKEYIDDTKKLANDKIAAAILKTTKTQDDRQHEIAAQYLTTQNLAIGRLWYRNISIFCRWGAFAFAAFGMILVYFEISGGYTILLALPILIFHVMTWAALYKLSHVCKKAKELGHAASAPISEEARTMMRELKRKSTTGGLTAEHQHEA